MHLGIADDAFWRALRPGLELRLHERDEVAAVAQVPERREERDAQRDERDVGHDEVDPLGKVEALARVHSFARDDPRIRAEPPVQLTFPDIDGVDPSGAALQETVGEPARRRAHVERDRAGDVDAKLVERGVQLVTTARHEPWSRRDRDRHGVGDRSGGAIGDLAIHAYGAGEDERLRAFAARRERSLDEQLIETRARCHHRRKPIPRLRAMPKRLPRSRTLKGDPKLAYYDSAGGAAGEPPIVLVHGATFRSEDWENIFPRLATRYRVIAYDARGHGKSARASSYGIDAFADDLLRVIDGVAAAPAIVIGHSLGGATALVAAAKRPAAIRALVLEEPVVDNWDRDWRAQYYKDVRAALDRAADLGAFRRAVASVPLPARGPRGERTVGEVRGFYAADRLVAYYKDVDPAFVEQFGHTKPDGHELVVRAVPPVPTLLLAAHPADGSALREGEAEALVARWPDAQLVKFPGVGHRIHGLRPEPFLEALEPFLRKARVPEAVR